MTFRKLVKPLLISLLLCCAAVTVQAQHRQQDVVFLHNGSMVRGEIIEHIVDSHVKIQTVDGSIWVFQMDEVREVTQVEKYNSKSHTIEPGNSGFYNLTDIGVLSGRDANSSILTLSGQTVCGYRISQRFSAGIGTGFENYNTVLAPVFAEGRYYFLQRNFSPFVALQAGYGIPVNNYRDYSGAWTHKGGVMANATVGIRNYLSNNVALVLSAGYRHQQSVSSTYQWWFGEGDSAELKHLYNRFVLRIGVLFQ